MKNLTSIEMNAVSGGDCTDLNELQTCVTQLYNNVKHAEEEMAKVSQLFNDAEISINISTKAAQLYNDANRANNH